MMRSSHERVVRFMSGARAFSGRLRGPGTWSAIRYCACSSVDRFTPDSA